MAKIKLSPLVTDIKGSTDDLLFSSSRGINTVRRRVTPTNPDTQLQKKSRTALTTLMGMWAQLQGLYVSAFEYGDVKKNQTIINRFLAQNLSQEMTLGEYSLCPGTSTPRVVGFTASEVEACNNTSVAFAPSPVPDKHNLVIWHRVDSSVPDAPPVMRKYTWGQGTNSPVSVPIINCEDGDNYVYGNFQDTISDLMGEGKGYLVELI